MLAVLKREMKSAFSSPLAYVVLCFFCLLNGFLFFLILGNYTAASFQVMQNQFYMGDFTVTEGVLRPHLRDMAFLFLLVAPLFTMRLLAEERKSGTLELLLTYPLRDSQIVLGKFLASLVVFSCVLLLSLFYSLIVSQFARVEWLSLLSGYLGLLGLGAALLSLGLWASSLTDNQIVAAMISFVGGIFFWITGWASSLASSGNKVIFQQLSLPEHFESFSKGVLNTTDFTFYLFFTVFFLFLTLRTLEARNWRGTR